ncbi:MAG: hypothetical protein CMK83_25435 [Pseudomonadales bacterium]|jgi:hypothetical protein|nr:hypothetical protein [Pseudomonadales bacterium]MCK5790062.1 hypothetical protein [Ketobacter sp.]MEC8814169.1 hypothetical protein [Pseudomonadota bacterium]TNC84992.1 MAG: hypothetical protein CSH49_18495 [Alcanivorax sp.]HAG93263.1 hypothetical protein [Gammaproteobacteria bacterium]|tara:strand:- start:282 stop:533 length:252 start_codon:yes stop_codon:yes gene_type:complete
MPKIEKLRAWLLGYALLFAAFARADATPLPEAFWNYFIEYGDQQGELFDPVDLAESEQVKPQTDKHPTQGHRPNPNDNEEQQP